jgi:hypothetical protein
MRTPRFLMIVALAASLAACATAPPPRVVIQPVSIVPHIDVPKADPVVPQSVEWKVYNADELKALGASLQANGGNVTLFTLDEANFKKLSGNLVDVKTYIKQQKAIIDFLTGVVNDPSRLQEEAKALPKAK